MGIVAVIVSWIFLLIGIGVILYFFIKLDQIIRLLQDIRDKLNQG